MSGSDLSLRLEVAGVFVNTGWDVMRRGRAAGWRSNQPPPPLPPPTQNVAQPLSTSPRPRAHNQRDSQHHRTDEGGTTERHRSIRPSHHATAAPGRSSLASPQPPPPPPSLPHPQLRRGLFLPAELRLGPVVQRAREHGRPLLRRWVPAGPWVSTFPGDDQQGVRVASNPRTPPDLSDTPPIADQEPTPARARGVFTVSRSRHQRSTNPNSGIILKATTSKTTLTRRRCRPVSRAKKVKLACRKQSLTDVSIESNDKKKKKFESCTSIVHQSFSPLGTWPSVYHLRCIMPSFTPYIRTLVKERIPIKRPSAPKWTHPGQTYRNPWIILRRQFELSKPGRRPWLNGVSPVDNKAPSGRRRRTVDSGWIPGLCLRCLQPIVTYR